MAPSGALLPTLGRWRAGRQDRLDRYLRLQERLLGRSEEDYLASAERPGGYLTLLRGIALERENLAWADRVAAQFTSRLPAPASRTGRDRAWPAGDCRRIAPAGPPAACAPPP